MGDQQNKEKTQNSKPEKKEPKPARVSIALSCDKYIDGQDRLAGYVILNGECVGNITADDISRALQRGELKVVSIQTKAN